MFAARGVASLTRFPPRPMEMTRASEPGRRRVCWGGGLAGYGRDCAREALGRGRAATRDTVARRVGRAPSKIQIRR